MQVWTIDSASLKAPAERQTPSPSARPHRPRNRRPLLWAAVLLGILGYASLQMLGTSVEPTPSPSRYRPVEIVVRGGMALAHRAMETPADMAETRVSFHFPEIPLDVEKRAGELSLASDGSFEVRLSLYCRRRPHQCTVTFSRAGYKDQCLPDVPLSGGEVLQASLTPVVLEASQLGEGASGP